MILRSQEAHVRSTGSAHRLNGVADQRAFAHGAFAAIEKNIGGFLRLQVVVVLDVVAANLNVADFAGDDFDAALLAIADVVAVNVGLMQIQAVEKDADAAVVVDVTIGDIDVAGAIDDVNAVPAFTDEDAGDGGLHDTIEANAVSLGMVANDFQIADRGHSFL